MNNITPEEVIAQKFQGRFSDLEAKHNQDVSDLMEWASRSIAAINQATSSGKEVSVEIIDGEFEVVIKDTQAEMRVNRPQWAYAVWK